MQASRDQSRGCAQRGRERQGPHCLWRSCGSSIEAAVPDPGIIRVNVVDARTDAGHATHHWLFARAQGCDGEHSLRRSA